MTGDSAELLARLFPFHVRIDADGRVAGMGPSMAKAAAGSEGKPFLDRFEVLRPRLSGLADLRKNLDSLVVVGIRGTPLQLRGQFTALADGHVGFVGSPRIVDQSSAWSWPVGVRDFAPHDGSADYAMVIEAANMQLADLDRLVRSLQQKERAERELRERAESSSIAKTNFLANISHELRTPMTAILGFAELLRDAKAPAEERADWIETIRRNGDHLLAIINDLLDLSKVEVGKLDIELAPVSVPDVVRDVVRLMRVRAVSQGISLDHVVEDEAAREPVRTDPVRVRQILLNLVGNAVKFTERGGVDVRVSGRRDGGLLRLSVAVRDTGCGIDPALMQRLFEPFTQLDTTFVRKHGGTGLGLAISSRLASLLNGRIEVASEPGRGSVFTLHLDCEVADAAEVDAAAPPPIPIAAQRREGPLTGRQVLLVEDSVDSQRIIAALLKIAGAAVDVAADGISAVSRFDGKYSPDIVLMDIQMPGMDGLEAAQRIRARGYRGRIVALTAAALSIDRERARAAGCESVQLKPISREDLIAVCAGGPPQAG
jgi:signal transduction histidine kinase/CheY-like chemotaxis protein